VNAPFAFTPVIYRYQPWVLCDRRNQSSDPACLLAVHFAWAYARMNLGMCTYEQGSG
jgi:hypothetical protein